MKNFAVPALVIFLGLAALTQPALASPSQKEAAKTAALVAALQAVSPDPLGGRLGLAATASRSESAPMVSTTTTVKGITQLDIDHRAYVVWKSSQKS